MTGNHRRATKIVLETETHDRFLDFELLGTTTVQVGKPVEIANLGMLTLEENYGTKALDSPETFRFLLEFRGNVTASVVANWIYRKLSGRAAKIKIDRVEVEVDEGEIRRVIRERIEVGK